MSLVLVRVSGSDKLANSHHTLHEKDGHGHGLVAHSPWVQLYSKEKLNKSYDSNGHYQVDHASHAWPYNQPKILLSVINLNHQEFWPYALSSDAPITSCHMMHVSSYWSIDQTFSWCKQSTAIIVYSIIILTFWFPYLVYNVEWKRFDEECFMSTGIVEW